MSQTADILNGLYLFKSLIKDGCEWRGDVWSSKWSDCLYMTQGDSRRKVLLTLANYTEGKDYKLEGNINAATFEPVGIWIA
jgi:hypothetical protein